MNQYARLEIRFPQSTETFDKLTALLVYNQLIITLTSPIVFQLFGHMKLQMNHLQNI